MRSRPLPVAAALAALVLLLPLPAASQDGSSSITFDEVSFTFDETLGASVNVTRVPPGRTADEGPTAQGPGRLAFTLYGPRADGRRIPRTYEGIGAVRVYRASDVADYGWQSQQLAQLQTLLDERPDLASVTAPGEYGLPTPLPFVLDGSAGQAIHARAEYVDTPALSGIAYLTVFRQDLYPFAAEDFWYSFQGLSPDGQWYVAVDVPVEASMFPDEFSQRQVRRLTRSDRWVAYLAESVETLDAAAPAAFTPPLDSIDALVWSISFDS